MCYHRFCVCIWFSKINGPLLSPQLSSFLSVSYLIEKPLLHLQIACFRRRWWGWCGMLTMEDNDMMLYAHHQRCWWCRVAPVVDDAPRHPWIACSVPASVLCCHTRLIWFDIVVRTVSHIGGVSPVPPVWGWVLGSSSSISPTIVFRRARRTLLCALTIFFSRRYKKYLYR